MWSNVHTHANYCDGKEAMASYAIQARSLGMLSLGFSSHAPLPFECDWCMKGERLDAYLQEIEGLKQQFPAIQFYKGLEVDFVPGVTSPDRFADRLDYTIGSIHFVDQLPDGRYWEIDGSHTNFLEGLAQLFNGDIRAAISRYFELTRQMISESCPTVVGHVDKIKIQNIGEKFFSEDDAWYRGEVGATLEVIAASRAIVEVNTRGLYQRKSTTPYPSPWILTLMRDLGIPITLNADAHHPKDLTHYFSETALQLRQLGFTTLNILYDGQWQPFAFDEHGIIQ